MLPDNIPLALGEIILFIGRIVWIVSNGPEISSENKYQIKLKRDVWEGSSIEYYEMIKSLEVCPFSFCELQRTIEECRIKLTKVLGFKLYLLEIKMHVISVFVDLDVG